MARNDYMKSACGAVKINSNTWTTLPNTGQTYLLTCGDNALLPDSVDADKGFLHDGKHHYKPDASVAIYSCCELTASAGTLAATPSGASITMPAQDAAITAYTTKPKAALYDITMPSSITRIQFRTFSRTLARTQSR